MTMRGRVIVTIGLTTCVAAAAVQAARQTQQSPVFRTRADSVSVDVSVRDGNVPVPGLGAADFRLLDNGAVQKIETVSLGAVPIDVTLFLDTSGSTEGAIATMKADVVKIAAMLRPEDKLRVLTFDDQVHDVFGWQPAAGNLHVDDVREGTVSSPVYDAILLAMLRRPDPDRRHLIVAITDGVDNGSWIGSATVRDVARRAEAVLHIVIIRGTGIATGHAPPGKFAARSRPDAGSEGNLDEAATLTGGKLYKDPILGFHERIVSAFGKAFEDFRQSYVLRFSPANVPREGWHDLRVEVPGHTKFTIRARKGYFGD